PLCAFDSRHPALMSAAAFLIRTFGAHAVPPAKSLLDAAATFRVGEIMPEFRGKATWGRRMAVSGSRERDISLHGQGTTRIQDDAGSRKAVLAPRRRRRATLIRP